MILKDGFIQLNIYKSISFFLYSISGLCQKLLKIPSPKQQAKILGNPSFNPSLYIRHTLSSKQIVHKISFSHYFWASDPLIDGFY